MNRARSFVVVTWDGGGNVPPMLSLGKRLRQRGHEVRVLSTAALGDRVRHAGLVFRAFEGVPDWDPADGRAVEDHPMVVGAQLVGPEVFEGLFKELEREPADAVVIDYMQASAISAAQAAQVPTALLLHTLSGFARENGQTMKVAVPFLNPQREKVGLPPLDERVGLHEQVWPQCGRVLGAMVAELDGVAQPAGNLFYAGPLLDPEPTPWEWDLPWPADDPTPMVVVSMGTTYQRHERQLEQAIQACEAAGVHVLVTLGPALSPGEIDAAPSVTVRRWVPHPWVFPHAAAVVTHAGLGTVMGALAYGVPMVCMPLGRDQPLNAARVQDCGFGISVDADADIASLRAAIETLLDTSDFSEKIRSLALRLDCEALADRAAVEIEALADPGQGSGDQL